MTCNEKLLRKKKKKEEVVFVVQKYAGYPDTTNATENGKRYGNQLAVIESKNLSGNNFPLISLVRGKLFPDRYLHPIPAC